MEKRLWKKLRFLIAIYLTSYAATAHCSDQIRITCITKIADASPEIDKNNSAPRNFAIKVDGGNFQIFQSVIDHSNSLDNLLVKRIDHTVIEALRNDNNFPDNTQRFVRATVNRYEGTIELLNQIKISGRVLWTVYRGGCVSYDPPQQKF